MSQYLGQDRQARRDHRPAVRLTGRGAVVAMLAVFALGLLVESWLGQTLVAGVAYLAGCVAAARYTKPAHLLTVAVSPPLLFLCALITVKVATASGNVMVSAFGGAVLTLAGTAPWLFAGTALALAICWLRGLPGCIRELRREIRSGLRRPDAASVARGGSAPRREEFRR